MDNPATSVWLYELSDWERKDALDVHHKLELAEIEVEILKARLRTYRARGSMRHSRRIRSVFPVIGTSPDQGEVEDQLPVADAGGPPVQPVADDAAPTPTETRRINRRRLKR